MYIIFISIFSIFYIFFYFFLFFYFSIFLFFSIFSIFFFYFSVFYLFDLLGTDTSAGLFAWLFYCLSLNPHVAQKARQEALSVLLDGNEPFENLDINTLREFQPADLSHLKYIECVVK